MSKNCQITEHNRLIVDQFTAMAAPFAQMPAHSEEASLRLLCDAAKVQPADRVLDVCCGTGIVSCAMAACGGHITGIDITPAMIDQARLLQAKKGLANITWEIGDVASLPFPDGAFSVVLSRYAFHHLLDPTRVLNEMARVCRPDGRIVLADVFVVSPEQGTAYDRVEKLRDPSHARALQLDEQRLMFANSGRHLVGTEFYRLTVDLESLLIASRTPPAEAEQVRRLIAADIGKNETGFEARRIGHAIEFSFPVVVLVAEKRMTTDWTVRRQREWPQRALKGKETIDRVQRLCAFGFSTLFHPNLSFRSSRRQISRGLTLMDADLMPNPR